MLFKVQTKRTQRIEKKEKIKEKKEQRKIKRERERTQLEILEEGERNVKGRERL